ncbi:MAG: Ig-like domain-containing protein [Maribacter litoralis]|uniref:Ig-like domain-containing protein n=1 Tax=Maribacter litoralis TaxID=2059726 RepID=UPI00329705FE
MRNLHIPARMTALLCLVFIFHSCSKDADLLSEYVITKDDNATNLQTYVVNDVFYINNNTDIVLDVLNNDNFEELSNVSITNTSTAQNGTIIINIDNTLTYTPKEEVTETEDFEDTFTYTAEEVQEDGTVAEEEATVTVSNDDSVLEETNRNSNEITDEVKEWQEKFDTEWNRAKSYYTSQTIGPEVGGQRRYYDFRVIDGLIYMFQATGDIKYIENFFWYVDRIKQLAQPSTFHNDEYYDWEVLSGNDKIANQLYDGHGLRNIFKMLWLLKKYPEIRSQSNFQEKYDEYLPWFTRNLWEKWESRGINKIIRSKTHMASHMSSNTALYLHLLEEDIEKSNDYLGWVQAFNNNLSSKSNIYNGGFRNQLRINDPHDGYVWSGTWGNMSGSNDLTHANAEVQAIINQYEHDIEWNATDINLFLNTLNNVIDQATDSDLSDIPFFIDLSDNSGNVRTFSYGWAMLGRFDQSTQNKLKTFSIKKNQDSYYYNVYIGIMALNSAYLKNNVIYPE